jgi:hypothetical protein
MNEIKSQGYTSDSTPSVSTSIPHSSQSDISLHFEQKEKENHAFEADVVSTELLRDLTTSWASAQAIVYSDFPRLCRRINVNVNGVGDIIKGGKVVYDQYNCHKRFHASSNVSLTHPSTHVTTLNDNASASAQSLWNCICDVICAISFHLESEKVTSSLFLEFQKQHASISTQSHIVQSLEHVLTSTLELKSSPTFAVLRAIHQSILFPAMLVWKTAFESKIGPMKDVRRDDAWYVCIISFVSFYCLFFALFLFLNYVELLLLQNELWLFSFVRSRDYFCV